MGNGYSVQKIATWKWLKQRNDVICVVGELLPVFSPFKYFPCFGEECIVRLLDIQKGTF
jgi:hypothetical protein